VSTLTWKIVTTNDRLERWFPLTSCEHVYCCKLDTETGQHFLFHRGARWYYLNAQPSGQLVLRRAWLHEYCSWYTRIDENQYDATQQYFTSTVLD